MRNEEVVRSFIVGCRASNRNLSTDGSRLYSYGLLIAARSQNPGNVITVWNYTASGKFHSVTTSTHVGLIKRLAPDHFLAQPLT